LAGESDSESGIKGKATMKFSRFILLLTTGLLTSLCAYGNDTVYAIDVSPDMQRSCGDSETLLSRALDWVALDAASTGEETVYLAMDRGVRVLETLSSISILSSHAAQEFPSEASLDRSLDAVIHHVRSAVSAGSLETPRVVVIAAAANPSVATWQQLLMLQSQGARFEWVAVGADPSADQLAGLGFERVTSLHCVEKTEIDPDLLNMVRELAADQAGLALAQVSPGADLIEDLAMDYVDAFEVLARACEIKGVVLPDPPDMTRLADIALYLNTAKADAGQRVRGGVKLKLPEPVYMQTIYFGTNRAPAEDAGVKPYFGGKRAEGGGITYGVCRVSIPVAAHESGKLESPFLALDVFADPKKHIVLHKVNVLERELFFEQLKQQLAEGRADEEWSQDILVFIHGFNVRFSEAARRTAQIAYDLDFNGAPVVFSWPSNGKLYAYISDREDVEWSIPHIERFLVDLVERAQPKRIHLITHSMGTEGTVRALYNMALRRGPGAESVFENVILAAPDFDAVIFSDQLAPEVRSIARRWTIYASDKDVALNLSASLRFAPRLGIPVPLADGIDTIDATGLEVTPWSVPEFHTYFATKQRVLADLVSVLKGLAPPSRELKREFLGEKLFWVLESPSHGNP
jgi:esterase/lipase superfamily enzyme